MAVNPRDTSRRCPACGHTAEENGPTQEKFHCLSCGHNAHADTVGALKVLRAGLARCEAPPISKKTAEPTTPNWSSSPTGATCRTTPPTTPPAETFSHRSTRSPLRRRLALLEELLRAWPRWPDAGDNCGAVKVSYLVRCRWPRPQQLWRRGVRDFLRTESSHWRSSCCV
ncbi:zinc ribbon domain-containing protein [Streptomyces sp. NPDC020800]|uniref:zinc ribbon domain-containing protein n=1 Tax=Streptomyces sp. NPDC020800 TaxID=3365092 RepID=UPI00379DD47A